MSRHLEILHVQWSPRQTTVTHASTFYGVFHPDFPHSSCSQDSLRGEKVFKKGSEALVLEGGLQILRNREGCLVSLFKGRKMKTLSNHTNSIAANFLVVYLNHLWNFENIPVPRLYSKPVKSACLEWVGHKHG